MGCGFSRGRNLGGVGRSFEGGYEIREVVLDDVPQNVEIDGEIAVDQPISERDDLPPLDVRNRISRLSLQARCRFSNQLDKSLEGCRQHWVILEISP